MRARIHYTIFVVAVLLFFTVKVNAQRYHFENYTTENGLTHSAVLSISQLKNGEIWLGTNDGGINIYNGTEFKTLNKSSGLIDDVVYDLYVDETESVYICTNNGLCKYDNGAIDSIPFGDSLVPDRIFQMYQDRHGRKLLATAKGLAQLVNDTIYHYPTENQILNNASCISINEDANGNLWVSTLGSSAFKISSNNEVQSYSDGNNWKYNFSTFHPEEGVVWFLAHKGLFELKDGFISEKKLKVFGNKSPYFHSCIRDKNGTIWLGTKKGLVRIENGREKLFTTKNGLANDEVWKIFEDIEENIWITTKQNGVSKFSSELFELTNVDFGLPDNYVQTIFVDSKGNEWIGTKQGSVFLNRDTSFTLDHGSSKSHKICDIKEDNGNVYFVSHAGMQCFNQNGISDYRMDSDSLFTAYCLVIDENGPLLGGILGLGRIRNEKIILSNDEFNFPNTTVHTILKDTEDTYWFGTDEGLLQYKDSTLTKYGKKFGIANNKVRSIIQGPEGNIWVGSSDGIFYIRKENIRHFTVEEGLSSNTVYSMIFDREGSLWVGHQKGIDKLLINDSKIDSIRHYNSGRGFMANTCNNNAIALSANGNILIGTDQGVLKYNKEFDQFNNFETLTTITDIKLFSQPTDWSMYCDSLNKKGLPINPTLSFTENYFTFDFIGISHINSEAIKYKYRLEGFDEEWILAKNKRSAVYSNLPFGSYNFQVVSSNDEGIWNKEPVKFSFTITPPFWRTWWFYSLCALAALFVAISYYQIRTSNIKIRKRNEKIKRQNAIIEEKNVEILDSITYAKRIQEAILPSDIMLNELPDSFVYYKPKDIVSGDFYWMKKVDEILLIAAVDCTGHGVPGGFVSMVGHSGLNRAVSEYQLKRPGAILEKLSELVTETFDDGTEKGIKDGMDVAICSINRESLVLNFSGANNPLYLIRKSTNPLIDIHGESVPAKVLGNLHEIKGNRRPVGSSELKEEFTNHEIQLEQGDRVYIFSDGFPDQFGGTKGKKLMYKPFKKILSSYEDTPMREQSELLNNEFESWRGTIEQIDDICIIGFQV